MRRLVIAALALCLLFGHAPAVYAVDPPSAAEVAAAAAERAVFGLPNDDATVRFVLGGRDVGTASWGIPLTADEERALDLPARIQFGLDAEKQLLPAARALPTFAGAYFDQRANGALTVLLTEVTPEVKARLEALAPAESRGFSIQVADHSYAALKDAAAEGSAAWAAVAPEAPLYVVAVDVPENAVRLETASPPTMDLADALSRALGVRVILEQRVDAPQDACSTRDSCMSPMRAGIRIRKGSTTATSRCTMGFHVVVSSDERFLTAGHCGYSGSDSWYHTGYGLVGGELGTLFAPNGRDIMLVQIPDSQASNRIYGSSRKVVGHLWPAVGHVICASGAETNTIDCGTVTDDWTSWISSTSGFTVWGSSYRDIALTNGDSGAPIYYGGPTGTDTWAMGVFAAFSGSSGWFGRVGDALNAWGASVVVCC